jgi:L-alanine-DL-glutamate epimerase-like enolase superfamily enzyme
MSERLSSVPGEENLEIHDVRVKLLHAPIAERIGMSFGSLSQRSMALVEVESESGLVGYGEGWINYPPWAGHERVLATREGIRPLLLGQDATRINNLHARMVSELIPMGVQWGAVGPMMQAISGVDLALWDLVAKARGLKICDMLGGPVRESVPVYASGLGPDKVEETATYCRESGFAAVKVRIGFGLETDENNLAKVRQVMGRDAVLFADANQAWNLREALEAADMLRRHDISWIEEPLRGNRPEELEAFHLQTGLQVATGENVYGTQGFWPYVVSPHIGILQPDVSKTGGITEMAPICHLAVASQKLLIPHLYGGPVALAATLQLAACLRQVEYVEYDVRINPLRDELLVRRPRPENGHLRVPEGPGLDVEFNREVLTSFAATNDEHVESKSNP